MNNFNLDQPIIELASQTTRNYWTLRHAFEGLQIFGGIGSGKTSGSGRFIALKYLRAGFGGLVLTVKPDEREMWQEFCAISGRTQDLCIIEPGGRHSFNFLDYESRSSNGQDALTENVVQVLKTVIRAGEEKSSGKSDDPFWETALDMLIFNVIDLCRLAYGRVSILDMYNIVQTIPKSEEALAQEGASGKAFQQAFETARQRVTQQIDKWYTNLSLEYRKHLDEHEAVFEEQLIENIPDARMLKFLDQFFFDNFIGLSEKTRSIIDFTFAGFLFRLLREPVYSLFCKNLSTVTPQDSLKGKIILINLPTKLYHKVGRDCQILFKYIWQRTMEKRNVNENGRPVFLWADEAQNFIHEHDADFQATARSSRIATVYISQNLPNYYASMGGDKADYKVKSFMGTLGTKIFHANADIETNKYASDLVGEAFFEDRSDSLTVSKEFSRTRSRSLLVDKVMRPEEFVRLKTGGPINNFRVEGLLHKQGDMVINGQNHTKMVFNQHYIPS